MDKKVLRNLSYGIYVVSTIKEDKKVGCIVNSIMQVTSDPATVAVSINHDNYTNSIIKETGEFAVSILKENSDSKIIGEFGFKSSKDNDKFENIAYEEKDGMPVITDSCGYFSCKVIDKVETTTHTVFIGQVTNADDYTTDNPMTYKYYHEKLKGTSPKNAPTHEEEKETKLANKSQYLNYKYLCNLEYANADLLLGLF